MSQRALKLPEAHLCIWCFLNPATVDKWGPSCTACANGTPGDRASAYLAFLGRRK